MSLSLCAVLFLMINFIHVSYVSDVCYTLEPITFPVTLIGIAYCCKPLNVFRRFDNVTYGLYLCHFPVIQTLLLFGIVDYSKPLAFLLTLIATAILASLSWFLIEKPLMNRSN